MTSMLTDLRNLVPPELVSQVARQMHEPDVAVTKAYGAAIPACAAAIANRSDDHGFITHLVNLASGPAVDSDPAAAAMRLASSPTGVDTGNTAVSWLSSLFGTNLSGITGSLARYAGIQQSSATSLLMTCAPLVLGYFGRLIRTQNLTATDVASRLRAERAQFESALPAGFEMPRISRPSYEPAPAVVGENIHRPEPRRETWGYPLAALLAALAIGGLIWWSMQGPRHQEVARAKVGTTEPNAIGTKGTVAAPSVPAILELPKVTFHAGSLEDRVSRYLSSTGTGSMNFDLDRVAFDNGSSRLTPQSKAQIDNLASVLRAYPKASVNIAGHTDSVGKESANLALSRARAEAVAKALTSDGIAADRIHADGVGSTKPIADNSTAAGRAQNRRVTVEVSR